MADYNSMLAANPYSSPSYKQSLWQRVGSALGFRTEADAWRENMAIQEKEYAAQIEQMKFQNEFNSPVSQVDRMRQAGLNPDLQGLGDVSDAANPPEDPSSPMQSTGDGLKIANAVSTILDCASTGIAMAKGFGQLKSLRIANDAGEIENVSKAAQLAKWVFDNSRQPLNVDSSENDSMNDAFLLHDRLAQQIGLPKRYRKQFRQNLSMFYDNLDQQVSSWEQQGKLNDAKLGVARQVESSFFGDGSFPSMRIVNKNLVRLSDGLAEIALKRQNAEEGYKADYFENLSGEEAAAAVNAEMSNKRLYEGELNPITKASAENATNDFIAQQKQIDTIINSTMSHIVHDLKVQADKGDFFAESMLFSFALARLAQFNVGPKGVSFGLK